MNPHLLLSPDVTEWQLRLGAHRAQECERDNIKNQVIIIIIFV